MRKLIVILLCFPLFIFSQEERKYERTMSFSQFAKELKEAADKGVGYTLESCYITYDSIRDKKHLSQYQDYKERHYLGDGAITMGDMTIRDIKFNDTTEVRIEECKFGETGEDLTPTIQFRKCHFGTLKISSIDVKEVNIKESNIKNLTIHCEVQHTIERIDLKVFNSRISRLRAKVKKATDPDLMQSKLCMRLDSNEIEYGYLNNWSQYWIANNTITYLKVMGSKEGSSLRMQKNKFNGDITYPIRFFLIPNKDGKKYGMLSYNAGLDVSTHKFTTISLKSNTFNHKEIHNDTIFNKLLFQYKIYGENPMKLLSYDLFYWDDSKKIINVDAQIQDSSLQITSKNYTGKKIYNDSLNIEEKISFLKQYFKENKLNFQRVTPSRIEITNSEINEVSMIDNSAAFFSFTENQIKKAFKIKKLTIDTLTEFLDNTLPDYNRVHLDKTILNNLGILESGYHQYRDAQYYYGNEEFRDIDTANLEHYKQAINGLISQYRQFINILNQKGDGLKSLFVLKLKDIQTNQKMFEYYKDPNMDTWFNWKGYEFIKWYSDYGTNPFKALSFCFWAMLYFGMFYFIFYNDWDKIDRGFLIKRFNSVMDYFTTEKRIEDFYSSTHDKEMTTFTEFKNTLDKNKVHMPSMLASLAKPIYQISLLRYRFLNFSYRKAEFMAGRKWVDLEKKDRYWIGALTFFLTLTYIIYLVFVRALNSIVLSINAFSTLGFGTIPVRGFTKYVAIIEGFIGWFMLSIFIVSLLSQMMSV